MENVPFVFPTIILEHYVFVIHTLYISTQIQWHMETTEKDIMDKHALYCIFLYLHSCSFGAEKLD